MIYNRDDNGWYNSGSWFQDANDKDQEVYYEKKYCPSCTKKTEHERDECLPCHRRTLDANRSSWWASNSCWINKEASNNNEGVDNESIDDEGDDSGEDNEDEE